MNENREECLCHGGGEKIVGKMPPLFELKRKIEPRINTDEH